MSDDPKLVLVNHTIINMRQVTHVEYRETEPQAIIVYFVTGRKRMYKGDTARLLWEHMQGDPDLESAIKSRSSA